MMRSIVAAKPEQELSDWIAAQEQSSAAAMERAISATHLRRVRKPFGQIVIPARGSVLASPAIADWNPEPDYFFHWVRDSAIAMRTVAELIANARDDVERRRWTGHFEDFVRFSLRICEFNGGLRPEHAARTEDTAPEFRKFLRSPAEVRELVGDRVLGEPRFNPDGTIDIFRWSRPQYDGPALRALACLHFLEAGGTAGDDIISLLRRDLAFTIDHAGKPCIGPWEEEGEYRQHYYVAVVQLGALVHGRGWIEEPARTAAEVRLRTELEKHWSADDGIYAAMRPAAGNGRDDLVDAACLLAVLDADLPGGEHSVDDERVWATFAAIEDLFAREFPLNRGRTAPALGRNRADRYFGGGAWYPTTLAAAALCYRRALRRPERRNAYFARGDAFMATIRDLVPANGALSEQVDRMTGRQTSARDLTWSYAAFVTAARLRAKALGRPI